MTILTSWSGGCSTRGSGLVEGKEGCAKEGCGLLVWIRFELRMDVDGKAELTAENRPAYEGKSSKPQDRANSRHEYQGGIGVLVVLLDIVRIVLRGLLVHGIEIESGVIGLDGL